MSSLTHHARRSSYSHAFSYSMNKNTSFCLFFLFLVLILYLSYIHMIFKNAKSCYLIAAYDVGFFTLFQMLPNLHVTSLGTVLSQGMNAKKKHEVGQ